MTMRIGFFAEPSNPTEVEKAKEIAAVVMDLAKSLVKEETGQELSIYGSPEVIENSRVGLCSCVGKVVKFEGYTHIEHKSQV